MSLSYQHVHEVFFDAQIPEQANMVQLLTCSTANQKATGSRLGLVIYRRQKSAKARKKDVLPEFSAQLKTLQSVVEVNSNFGSN